MDWLLRTVIASLVRRGNLRIISARGKFYTFGDGTGERVVGRFTTWQSQLAVLLDPELKLGEAYMDGTFVVEQGTIADLLALRVTESYAAALGAPARRLRYVVAAAAAVQSARPRAPQRRASLRSRRPALFALPRCRPAIQLRLFRDAGHSPRRRPTRQEAPYRRQAAARARANACSTSAAAGAGSALYLAEICGADVTGITLSEEQHAIAQRARRGKGPRPSSVEFPPAGLSRRRRARSTASSRSACSSMSASASTTRSSANAPSCSPTTA